MIERVADSTALFLERAGARPFFLQISFLDPHDPYYQQVAGYPEEMADTTDLVLPAYSDNQKREKNNIAGHYNSTARVDKGFKMVLDKLKEAGKLENTVVIFIGDNGAPFPRGKVTMFEGGLRIPFIMSLPGQKEPAVFEQMISTVDIMPTFLEAAKIEAPEGLAGRSLLPLISGDEQWRKYLFAEFNSHTDKEFFPQRSINDGKFKLIYSPFAAVYREELEKTGSQDNRYKRNASTPVIQIFDLGADPYELVNLADDPKYFPEKERLITELNKWQKETNDPLVDHKSMEMYREIVGQFVAGKRDKLKMWQYKLD
jgi:N-sulfoglucosamine sulfohydrolase